MHAVSPPQALPFKPRGGGRADSVLNVDADPSPPPPLPLENAGGRDLTFDSENPFKYFSRWSGEVKPGKAMNHESLFLGVQTNCNNWGE